MDLNSHIAEFIKQPETEITYTPRDLKELVSVIDLTAINPQETEESIKELCQKASNSLGMVAGVCVAPKFVALAKTLLPSNKIKLVSIANFPTGNEKFETVFDDIKKAIAAGANEMDIVFPYTDYLKGRTKESLQFIEDCKKACGKALLKVILETSEFEHLDTIFTLSTEVINAGADFLKTSTGRSKQGATLEAASVMLLAIKSNSRKDVGFKASGGIKNIGQAMSYIKLAEKILDDKWVKSEHFRIGASSLLDNILAIKQN